MKFRINNGDIEDSIIITGETIADCREEAAKEISRRGWNEDDCWSEEIPEEDLP